MNNNSNKNAHHQHYGNREFSLFVGDLPHDCSDDKLQHLYQSRFKSVKRVQIIRNDDGQSRGFGFIRFEELAEFEKALAEGMKIDNTTLRVDTAHRNYKAKSRYGSFNSVSSNNSNHHNHHQFNNNNSNLHHQHHHQHHHNPAHHHHHQQQQQHQSQAQSQQQHGSQQHHPPNQQGQNNNKILMTDQNVGGQPLSQGSSHQGAHSSSGASSNASPRVSKGPMHLSGMGVGGSGQGSQAAGAQHSHTHQQSNQLLHNQHNAHLNHSLFNSSQQKMSQHHTGSETRGSKQQQQSQPNHSQGGDEATKSMAPTQNKPPTRSSPHQPSQQQAQSTPLPQPQAQQNPTQMNNNAIGVAVPSSNTSITATTTTATSLSSSDISHSTSVLPNSQLNINAGQPSLGPDLRGYAHATMMDNPHMLGATEPSVMPPSSVYGHIYPYGPPPFGYMPPPPQPNPVIPISAVPPAPPNQASSSGVGQQQHSMAAAAASGGRYNSSHHQQHHPHQAQQAHAGAPDVNAMSSMTAAGVQGPPTHQAPFYYYYPSPLYFDQTGAAAPPNLFHPQSYHPQFFALPNPAYLPNAHTYTNQHQTQAPLASQSDAGSATLVNQQQSQQPQSHQQQVNLRTRDIDAPIE